jgi:hypothetical protein
MKPPAFSSPSASIELTFPANPALQVHAPPDLSDLNYKSSAGAVNLQETYGSISMWVPTNQHRQ